LSVNQLISLTPEERRGLAKMGDKPEAFCRQTLMVLALAQNTQVIPSSLDISPRRKTTLPTWTDCARVSTACAICWAGAMTPIWPWAAMC
jgi:hypothetical protein